jgi:hypothetical protein
LLVKSDDMVKQHFQAAGPVANAAIDAVSTALAYPWGEPDSPLVQPTSCFRQASVSKTVTHWQFISDRSQAAQSLR